MKKGDVIMYYSATRMVRKIYCIGRLTNVGGNNLYYLLSRSVKNQNQKVFQFYGPRIINEKIQSLIFGIEKENFCWCFERSIHFDVEECISINAGVIEIELPIPIPMMKKEFAGFNRSNGYAYIRSDDVELAKQLIEKRNPLHKRDIAYFDRLLISIGNSAFIVTSTVIGHPDEITRLIENMRRIKKARVDLRQKKIAKLRIKEDKKYMRKGLKIHSPTCLLLRIYKKYSYISGKGLKELLYSSDDLIKYRKQLFENPKTHPPAMAKMYLITRLDRRHIKIQVAEV